MIVEFPILIPKRAIRLAGIVVPFVFKAHGDAIVAKRPQLFLQAIVQFFVPFAPQKFDDLSALAARIPTRMNARLLK